MPLAPRLLHAESFLNPLGLHAPHPILSWQATGPDGLFSTAFQILAAATREALDQDQADLWDTTWLAQERTNQISYAGPALSSRQRVWWKIRLKDNQDEISPWSEPAFFEMGLLQSTDWTAQWIGSAITGGPRVTAPSPYLRKEFATSSDIKSGRLHVTALGLYECEVNGTRIGDDVFTPGWTDYNKRVQYQTYDVTSLIRQGPNAIGAILGDGWYCGHIEWRNRQMYGDRPWFLSQLEITLADGSRQIIPTDATWKTTIGPILESDTIVGESYDARRELGAWSSPNYAEATWSSVTLGPKYPHPIVASASPRVRRINELHPIAPPVIKDIWPQPLSIFDFGQNLSGRARLKIKAPGGSTIRIRYAEALNPDGTIYVENLRAARCIDFYTCSGNGEETWEPRFTFHGFRYVELTGYPKDAILDVTAMALHSDTPAAGTFACSNSLLNQLQHNIQWGQKGNFLEVPTDCPQRDERLGWTGDAQVFVRTACFNFDVQGFFNKWIQDLRDAQGSKGQIPMVAPNPQDPEADGGPAWSDATIICPWTIYLCYGDRRILEHHYASMQRFIDYLLAHRCKGHIRSHVDVDKWGGFGDWLALDGRDAWSGGTPKDLIGTAYLAHDADLMSRIALILGKKEDAAKYRELHEKTVAAFQNRFVTPEGLVAGGTQTSYVLALHFNLLPENLRAPAAKELVCDIEGRKWHLTTGFVGTSYLCPVLADHGYLDIAYKLLEQETYPSWLFPVKNGATTIWERWDGWTPEKGFQDKAMNSFNHYAYGAIGAWMYRTVAGLDLDPADPGYRHILFCPRPGGTLTWAEATLPTPYGPASIRWDKKEKSLEVQLTIPTNARATFIPPDNYPGEKREFQSGTHRFSCSGGL